MTQFKLGRTARSFNPRIPHLSALLAAAAILPPLPATVDWTTAGKMPANLGMMANDVLGDCTCAAVYHARQVWTANTFGMHTAPDFDVKQLYQEACGWDPSQPGEGPGGNEQAVLEYILKTGMPVGPNAVGRHKISAFVEVDPRMQEDVKRTIWACGVAYIGFSVPSSLFANGAPASTWDVVPGQTESVGGHAVILAGYTPTTLKVVSWGQYYEMTWAFFDKFVEEVYAIADDTWFTSKGTDPLGLTLAQLEAQMNAIKES